MRLEVVQAAGLSVFVGVTDIEQGIPGKTNETQRFNLMEEAAIGGLEWKRWALQVGRLYKSTWWERATRNSPTGGICLGQGQLRSVRWS